ncbi:glycosyltransferase [bacterium]|nr:glycosyltransferase [bacterium]
MEQLTPQFSVIIPARNEEELLSRAIESIRAAASYSNATVEIIVVLNRCTDSTEQVAQSQGALILVNNEKNLAMIRNTGLKAARGEILVTMDADSQMSKNMFFEIHRRLATGKSIGGGVMLYPERYSLGIIASILCLVPYSLWHGISAGLFFSLRRDFIAIGGFNETLLCAEDVDFAKRLKAYGKTQDKKFTTIFNAWIVTSCRKFDKFGDWYFVSRPLTMLRLLKGKDRRYADMIWYDFPRE